MHRCPCATTAYVRTAVRMCSHQASRHQWNGPVARRVCIAPAPDTDERVGIGPLLMSAGACSLGSCGRGTVPCRPICSAASKSRGVCGPLRVSFVHKMLRYSAAGAGDTHKNPKSRCCIPLGSTSHVHRADYPRCEYACVWCPYCDCDTIAGAIFACSTSCVVATARRYLSRDAL